MAKEALTDEMMRTQLHRERRLLLAVSLVLLAHQILGIEVSNSAESLGVRFEVANPDRLWIAVWVVWTWAIVRYAQVLNSFDPRSDYPTTVRNLAYQRIGGRVATRRVRKETSALLRSEVPSSQRLGVSVKVTDWLVGEPPRQARVESATWVRFDVIRRMRRSGGEERPRDLTALGSKSMTRKDVENWVHTGGGASQEAHGFAVSDTVLVPMDPVYRVWWVRAAALTWTGVTTSYLTEYFAPLAIGLAPLLLALGPPMTAALISAMNGACS